MGHDSLFGGIQKVHDSSPFSLPPYYRRRVMIISPRLVRRCSVSATTRWCGCSFLSSSATVATPATRSDEIDDDVSDATSSSSPSHQASACSPAARRSVGGVCHCLDPPTCPRACTALLHIDRQHVLHPYTSMIDPLPTFPVQGARGVHITLADGRRLIDGMSSWWAAVHGYRHPILDEAMTRQIHNSMSHVMFGGLTHRPAVELTMRLLQLVNNDYRTPSTATAASTTNTCTLLSSLSDIQLEKMHNEYHFTKVFYSDSGSIAVEVAMKMAIQYWHNTTQQQQQQNQSKTTTTIQKKNKFLSLQNGYHGDTFGAMSVCDPINGMHTMFSGVLSTQYFVPSPTGPTISDTINALTQIEEILQTHHEEIAAIILEPIVQGAGGMKFYHPTLLQQIRQLCNTYNVLLIYDEIATGFGRTGTLFGGWQNYKSYKPWSSLLDVVVSVNNDNDQQQEGSGTSSISNDDQNFHNDNDDNNNNNINSSEIVYPDIVCLGKALTGGYVTLGATITTNRVANGISNGGGVFMHGPTFMANPLACAVSLASLNLLLSSPWKERVRTVNKSLITSLSPLTELTSIVKEVRVLGAIGVCELHEGLDRDQMALVQQQLVNEGVWLRPFGKLLYTMPPFNCEELTKDHVQKIGQAMYNVASKL